MSYLLNLLQLTFGGRTLRPLMAIYYLTQHCNLNCAYCEDFGARRNPQLPGHLPLEQAKTLLQHIRGGVDSLWLTGGEPLLVPHLPELLTFARRELRYRSLSLITNGSLLPQRPEIYPLLNRLIISLDSLNPADLAALNLPAAYAASLPETIRHAAALQKEHGFRLLLNAVITPQNLQPQGYDQLLQFCAENNIRVSFSPQSFNNLPVYELTVSPAYHSLLQHLLRRKREGAPILGSPAYLQTMQTLQPYNCYPTLIPRILPNGDLEYPCRPIAQAGGEQGGHEINLLQYPSWQAAWDAAQKRYGEAPSACNSCFQQCYAEPSLMQAHPLQNLSQPGSLSTYAPG
jgi:MoaA/NifB/PqqE/SkfB family radical SAM enzyme